ncbi:MAG: hypothetical protein ACLFWH_05310 [Actinomycetota bacterium]
MTTTTEKIEEARQKGLEEIDAARDAGDSEAFLAAFKKFDEAEKARRRAVRTAIEDAAPGATKLGIKGVESIVDLVVEYADTGLGTTEMAQDVARVLAKNSLLVKVLSAYEAEWRALQDEPPADGVVGRACDEAIETLRPYWEKHL